MRPLVNEKISDMMKKLIGLIHTKRPSLTKKEFPQFYIINLIKGGTIKRQAWAVAAVKKAKKINMQFIKLNNKIF